MTIEYIDGVRKYYDGFIAERDNDFVYLSVEGRIIRIPVVIIRTVEICN